MIIGVYSFFSFPKPPFGQNLRMIKILKQFSKSNKVVVYSPAVHKNNTPNPYEEEIRSIGIEYFDFNLEQEYAFLNDVRVHRFLKREYKRGNFDVLQLENSLGTFSLMRKCNVPKVGVFQTRGADEISFWTRGQLLQGNVKNFLRGRYLMFYSTLCERTLACKSSFVITTSQQVKEYTVNLGANPKKIVIARNGVDLEEYQRYSRSADKLTLRRKLGIPENAFVFIFHGSFDFPQNVEAVRNILEIRNCLKKSELAEDYRFLIVGGPVERLNTRVLYTDARDNDVYFTGYVEDVKPYLFSADCGLAPFPEDALSGGRIKIVEFLAAGLPVIATKTGIYGLEELVYDEPVYIIRDPKDTRNLLPVPKVDVNKSKLKNFDWSKTASTNEKILREAFENQFS